jgi:integrase
MADLSKIGERERLKPRKGDEPHWQRITNGCYVGFRPSKRGGRGTWLARAYDADIRKYKRATLGDYPTLSGHEVFNQARRDAERWAASVDSGGTGPQDISTVGDACLAYAATKQPSELGILKRTVLNDPIAKVKLKKLRRHHLYDWKKRLEDTPALISRNKTNITTKQRSKSTVNRDMSPLRAALRMVLSEGAPNTDAAWQEALRPYRNADGRRALFLDEEDRKKLVLCANPEIEGFLRGLCFLPLRAGALAALTVKDFDPKTRTLTIGRDKNGAARQIPVAPNMASMLERYCKDRLPASPIFARHDGRPWNKDAWKGPIKEAALAAELPLGVCAYTLRHSVTTELIRKGVPALTVAQLSGTSVAMIERHYGHLVQGDAEKALAGLVF